MLPIWRPDAKTILKNKKVRVSLARYFDIMECNKPAKFLISKKLSVIFNKNYSLQKLWKIHEQFTKKFRILEKEIDTRKKCLEKLDTPSQSFLDLKIEIAKRILENCHLCARRCGSDRTIGELGYCKCGKQITVSTIFPHIGEEPELVPSGTIFTLGCTLRCLYCQNWGISQWFEVGEIYSARQIAKAVENLQKSGCRNVNLVGGDPTSWLSQWFETFRFVNVNIPVVWNSNSYYSEETAKLLAGFVDVYLLDFKYGPKDCGIRLSEAPKYWIVSTQNHLYAQKYGELIIRVLVLPEHLDCCTKPILNWISKNLGVSVRINLMFQYRPEWRAQEVPELRRSLTKTERKLAIDLATEAGLTNFIT
jgi:putative pyruvate formate lyase activating enzyme